MRFALYGNKGECRQLEDMLESMGKMNCQETAFVQWEVYDEFIHQYMSTSADVLIVTADGGAGLEALNAGFNLAPAIPRVWFASDNSLGPQAVRMEVAFFAPKPFSKEVIEQALQHCHIRKNYYRSIDK